MTHNSPYPRPATIVEELMKFFPMAGAGINLSRPFIEGPMQDAIGISPWKAHSPFGQPQYPDYYSPDNRRATMDYMAAFSYQMGIGHKRHDSMVGNIIGAVGDELVNQRALGARAFREALGTIGAGRSFVHSSFGRTTTMGAAADIPTTPEDLLAAFTSIGTMKGGPLAVGERQMLLGRMLKRDKGLFAGLRGLGVLEGLQETETGMLSAGDTDLTEEAAKLLERSNEIRRGVKQLENAVASWKTVLNTDVDGALKAISQLFGGDAVATFSQGGDSLQAMALRVRHTAALTGTQVGAIMGGTQVASQLLGGFRGPQEAALMATTFSAAMAPGLVGYRGSEEQGQQAAIFATTNILSSTYGRLIAGGYVKYLGTEEGRKYGLGVEGQRAYTRLLNKHFRGDTPITVEGMNQALGVDATVEEYVKIGESDVARDFMALNPATTATVLESAAIELRQLVKEDTQFGRIIETMGEEDFYLAMSLSPEERDNALKRAGVSDSLRQWVNERGYTRLKEIADMRVRGGDALYDKMEPQTIARMLRQGYWEDLRVTQAEIDFRSRFEADTLYADSHLTAGLELLGQALSEGAEVSIGGLFSAITGAENVDKMIATGLGASTQEELAAFQKSMTRARDRLKGQKGVGEKDTRIVRTLFRELEVANVTGNKEGMGRIRNYIVSLFGGGFDKKTGMYSFDGTDVGSAKVEEIVGFANERDNVRRESDTLYEAAYVLSSEEQREAIVKERRKEKVKDRKKLAAMGITSEQREKIALLASAWSAVDMLPTQDSLAAYEYDKETNTYTDASTGLQRTTQEYKQMQHWAKTREALTKELGLGADKMDFDKVGDLLAQSPQGANLLETNLRSTGNLAADSGLQNAIVNALIKAFKQITVEVQEKQKQ